MQNLGDHRRVIAEDVVAECQRHRPDTPHTRAGSFQLIPPSPFISGWCHPTSCPRSVVGVTCTSEPVSSIASLYPSGALGSIPAFHRVCHPAM